MEVDHGELVGRQFPLPENFIVDILLALPVKSLMRFKCVSKPWRSLISSANFIALHTKKAVDDKHVMLQRRRVIFNVGPGDRGLYSINLDQFLQNHADNPYDDYVTATEVDFVREEFAQLYPEEDRDKPPCINFMYFCDNLLLCEVRRMLYMVNPATRQLKKLPETPKWRPGSAKGIYNGYDLRGLGFDHTTNDYKVVDGQWYEDGTLVWSVYTLRTNSWRQIESHSRYIPGIHRGIFLNGAIHWFAFNTHVDGGNQPIILSFSLEEDKFYEIQLPPIPRASCVILGAFRDCLCFTLSSCHKSFDEFWVMKEYKVTESWSKMLVLKAYKKILSHTGFSTQSHDVMVYDNSLVIYDDFREEKSNWKLQIRDIPDKIGTRVGVYVQGLFPLTNDRSMQRKTKKYMHKSRGTHLLR